MSIQTTIDRGRHTSTVCRSHLVFVIYFYVSVYMVAQKSGSIGPYIELDIFLPS